MAQRSFTLTVETTAYFDACDEVMGVFHALARRHGDRYRALERRIERLLEGENLMPDHVKLVDGGNLFVPPKEVTAILIEARRLELLK